MDENRGDGAGILEVSQADCMVMRPEPLSWVHLTATFFILLLFSWLGIDLSRQSDRVRRSGLRTDYCLRWWSFDHETNGFLTLLWDSRQTSWLMSIYGDPFPLAVGVSVANSVEVITSCVLLTRWFGNPFPLTKRRPLLAFLGVAVLGATAVTSAIGASWTLLFVNAGPWWMLFRTWYLGDVLGMAIIAPLVFILQRPGFFVVLQRQRLMNTLLVLYGAGNCDLPCLQPQQRPAHLPDLPCPVACSVSAGLPRHGAFHLSYRADLHFVHG